MEMEGARDAPGHDVGGAMVAAMAEAGYGGLAVAEADWNR